MVVYDDELANAEVWNGGGMNTTDSQFEKPWDQPATFWRAPIRFLFGYDIFISYARSDAEIYAELLETKLEALAYQPDQVAFSFTPPRLMRVSLPAFAPFFGS